MAEQFHKVKWLITSVILSFILLVLSITTTSLTGRAATLSTSSSTVQFTPSPIITSTVDLSINAPVTATASVVNDPDVVTSTATTTPTITTIISPTITPTPTFSPTPSPTPTVTPNPFSYLPLIFRQPTPIPYFPPDTDLFCDGLAQDLPIPDNDPNGISHAIWVADPRLIVDLDIVLDIKHSWVGDLVVNLTHNESGKTIELIHRPGIPGSDLGCKNNNISAILDDDISSMVEGKCAGSPAAISGIYIPNQPLDMFDGESIAGTWQINVADHYKNDTGALSGWCLVGKISTFGQPPSPTPIPPSVPPTAIISGVTGRDQALPLDCESRSAVDWAKYFGVYINEITFFNQLPYSDNPDKGFVGNVNDPWGKIPPNSYGVHAEPIATLLRAYGLPAYAHRPLSWDALRAEIAAGRPVIVWIVGSVQNGIPVYFTPPDGLDTIVARYEHTVVVTGYTQDNVYYLNGDTIYSRSVNQFLDSWSALGNMAVTTSP